MKEMIFEVVIGVLILSLLIMVIALFRSNMDIIGYSASSTSDIQKVAIGEWVPMLKNRCYGRDVAAVIRYYSQDDEVVVEVEADGVLKSYITETFELSEWSDPLFYEREFQQQITYDADGKQIEKIIYQKVNERK